MKKTIIALSLTTLVTACSEQVTTSESNSATTKQPSTSQIEDINASFNSFAKHFIEQFWQYNPGYGVYVGYYQYDDQLPVPNEDTRAKENHFYQTQLDKLNQFDVTKLNPSAASDFYILKNQLESSLWYSNDLKSHSWNPSNYNVAGVFGVILNTDYKPLEQRLEAIYRRMENIPAYYAAAQQNLTQPTVTHTELAIQQNQGALSLFNDSLAEKVAASQLSTAQKQQFEQSIATTTAAIQGYIDWLQQQLTVLKSAPDTRDFRIGETLYNTKFDYDIVAGFSAKKLYDKALAEKDRVHGEMIKLTEQLWPKYFPDTDVPVDRLKAVKSLIDHLSPRHVKRDEFVESIRQQIPELEAFVIKHNLVAMDKDKPLVVRETPKYQRGFAGASINAPGPYDAEANTYYNVTPLDNFNDEQAESYLREYNHWILQILNIHEAVPGHYTQLVHSNKTPSLVKSIFGNGAMVEGWAVYTERMMLEQGYGDSEPELWLMYYKWNMRVIMNSILDYRIQVLGLTEDEALDLMMNQAFQEEAEARGKWRRATLSQVQLTSYFTGYMAIYELREELKKATGDKFNLTDFHNQFLSYGSAPVPIIKQLMFDDYIKNHQ